MQNAESSTVPHKVPAIIISKLHAHVYKTINQLEGRNCLLYNCPIYTEVSNRREVLIGYERIAICTLKYSFKKCAFCVTNLKGISPTNCRSLILRCLCCYRRFYSSNFQYFCCIGPRKFFIRTYYPNSQADTSLMIGAFPI